MFPRKKDPHRRASGPNISSSSPVPPSHAPGFTIRHYVRTAIILVAVAAVVFTGTFVYASYLDLSNTLSSAGVKSIGIGGDKDVDLHDQQPLDIVLIGQDSREGAQNQAVALNNLPDEHHADTTIIMQIPASRKYINLVSIPRDTIVNQPACETSRGMLPARRGVMFNSIFEAAYNKGGDVSSAASCTVKTLRTITHLPLDQFIVVDFGGLREMINAVGGVNICIPLPIYDPYTQLRLPAGWLHLDGLQATQYARVRHGTGVGDGSDITRTARQQYLMKMLMRQIRKKNLITNSGELYKLVKAALNSLQMSKGLANLSTLTQLAYSLRHIGPADIYSQTAPEMPYPLNPNRVIFSPAATDLWKRMRDGKPLFDKHGLSPLPENSNNSNSGNSSNSSGSSQLSQQIQKLENRIYKIKQDLINAYGSRRTQLQQELQNAQQKRNQLIAQQQQNSNSGNSNPGSGTTNVSGTSTAGGTYEPSIGLVKMPNGTLIDPRTGGIVNPKSGLEVDPRTGYVVGIAEAYLNQVICKIPPQDQ